MDLASHPIDEPPAQAKETTVSIASTIEKDINIAETYVSAIATKVEGIVTKAEALEPAFATALSGLVAKTETFLASASPAVVGEGLNFPADSVAYASFVALFTEFQSVAATIAAGVKSL